MSARRPATRRPPQGKGRRPSRNPRDPRRARGQKKAPPRPPDSFDIHLRVGLEDILCRVAVEDWHQILVRWMLGGEDVIFRGLYEDHETNIVLRGSDSGVVTLRGRATERKLPLFKVIFAADERETLAAQFEKKD